ncbi:hypothetical protein FHS38_005464 [Streptomyces netropsis]|uniref:Uncharacterized protein n=1 Tax=Streptomyces netropsis TaxID=55404 RepID=A0A7W7LFV9_STRNE|nr:hypothetical protein [Streptomyces netropsis]
MAWRAPAARAVLPAPRPAAVVPAPETEAACGGLVSAAPDGVQAYRRTIRAGAGRTTRRARTVRRGRSLANSLVPFVFRWLLLFRGGIVTSAGEASTPLLCAVEKGERMSTRALTTGASDDEVPDLLDKAWGLL